MEVYYQLITNTANLRAICEEASVLQTIGLDTETTDLDPYKGELRLIQIATSPTTVKIIDLKKFPEPKTNPDLDCLRDLFFAARPTKVLHNAKFDAKWLKLHVGAELGGIFDTLLGSQILAAGETDRRHNLADVTYEFIGEELDKSEQVSNWSADELSPSQLEYAAKDAGVVLRIREKMIDRLKAENLIEVAKLEFDCVEPIAYLELAGIFLDRDCWSEQLEKVKKVQTVVADELQEMLSVGALQGSLFGRTEINLDSHTQLTQVLTRLGVPLPATTRNWQLEPLANDYPVIKKLLEYRSIQKAITSYGENILGYISPVTGRIHADFRQIGAPTGRMSCLSGETLISTVSGLNRIDKVWEGDLVKTPYGFKRVIKAWSNGVRPIFEIALADGRTIKATANHQFLTEKADAWKRLDELKVGDNLFVSLKTFGEDENSQTAPLLAFDVPIALSQTASASREGIKPFATFYKNKPIKPETVERLILKFGLLPSLKPIVDYLKLGLRQVAIKSITSCGEAEVFDLTVEDAHQFIANGIVVHNCNNPNIQQVPHGEEYRRCFRAPEGRKFVISDYCVAEGTRVATKRGLIPIEEMNLNDSVFLEDGSTTRISAVIKRGKLPVVKVTLKNGYSLKATTLHRIRVLDVAGKYVWRRIGELKASDAVAIQTSRGIADGNEKCKLPSIAFSHFNNIVFDYPKSANVNLALFAGYICGDGSLARNSVKWVVNQQDADVLKVIDETAAKLFNLQIHFRKPYRGVFESGLYSTPLAEWFNAVGIAKDRVPEFVWRGNSKIVCAFLRGLFEADGSVTNSETGKVSFASSRRRLAVEVHQLLLALGIPSTLRKQEGTGVEKKFSCWSVSVVANGLSVFAKEINFISRRKRQKLHGLLSRWTGKTVVGNMPNLQIKVRELHLSGEARRLLNNVSTLGRPISSLLAQTIESDFPQIAQSLSLKHLTDYKQLFLPVVSIKEAGETEVYDLSVPGAMTYISDGFVSHNSQIELRILADFTDDPGFVDAFNSGADLHRATAAQIFNVAPEAVTADQRSFAKRINFGVVYGIGAQRVSNLTGISLNEAQDLLRKYFATYRRLDSWLREAANKAVKERQARTVSGRLARFRFDAEDRQSVSLAERNGKNTPIQGCVIGETRIFEESLGYVEIKTLVDKQISVWDGEQFSKAFVAYSGNKQLVKVEFWGGFSIQCSPEHKFLTIDVNGRKKWRTPAQFVKGNYVVLTEAIGSWAVELNFPEFQPGKSWNANRLSLLEGTSEPSRFGEWLGRLASDGSLYGHQACLLIAQHEESILPQIKSFTAKFGHVTHQVRTGGRGTQPLHFLTLSSLGLVRQLNDSGAKSKIPNFAWRSSQILAGYLRGMFDGDGTVNPDGAVLTFGKGSDFHLEWAREIQQALLLFGVRSRLNRCADRINVCVLKRDMPLFCQRIGFINLLKQTKAAAIQPQTNYENKIYGRAARIKKVEFTDEFVDMYDVVNSETERFMANGLITHNSSADILKRALRILHDELRDTSACIVNVIHDEIVVETDANEAEAIAQKVEKGMCDAGEEYVKKVPIKVESVISNEWLK